MDPNWYIQYILATRRHDTDVANAERNTFLNQMDSFGVVTTRSNRLFKLLGSVGVLLVEIGFRMQSRFSPQPLSINKYLVAEHRSLETDHPC